MPRVTCTSAMWKWARRIGSGQGYLNVVLRSVLAERAQAIYWRQINEKLKGKGFDAWWLDADRAGSALQPRSSASARPHGADGDGPGDASSSTPIRCCTRGRVSQATGRADPDKRVFILTRKAIAGTAAQCGGGMERRYRFALGRYARPDFRRRQPLDVGPAELDLRHRRLRGGEALSRAQDPADLPEWRELNTALVPVRRVRAAVPFARRSSRSARSGTSRRKARGIRQHGLLQPAALHDCCRTSTRWPRDTYHRDGT